MAVGGHWSLTADFVIIRRGMVEGAAVPLSFSFVVGSLLVLVSRLPTLQFLNWK